jgi:hypothetical protein
MTAEVWLGFFLGILAMIVYLLLRWLFSPRKRSRTMREYRRMTEPVGEYHGDPLDPGEPDYNHPQARSCDLNKDAFQRLSEDIAAGRAEAYKNLQARAYGKIDESIWGAKAEKPEHWKHD